MVEKKKARTKIPKKVYVEVLILLEVKVDPKEHDLMEEALDAAKSSVEFSLTHGVKVLSRTDTDITPLVRDEGRVYISNPVIYRRLVEVRGTK